MTKVDIRQASLNDANDIFKVQRNSILNIKDYLYSQEIKQAWAPKDPTKIKEIIRSEKYYTVVAEINNKVVGFGSISNEEFELLFVDPNYQKLGIASQMLAHLESKATKPFKLKTPKNAVEFYHKKGYKIKSKFNTLIKSHIFDRFLVSKD
jgi:putative acetyltransferase